MPRKLNHSKQRLIITIIFVALFLNTLGYSGAQMNASLPNSAINNKTPIPSDSFGTINMSIPYVYKHYGYADGIVDPYEYKASFTDNVSGIKVWAEQNGTYLYLALRAPTSGSITFGWTNGTTSLSNTGFEGLDLITGYSPNDTYSTVLRAKAPYEITVDYVGRFPNGTIFDTSIQSIGMAAGLDKYSYSPLTVNLSNPNVIEGFYEGLLGMRVGEVRNVFIPPEKGYVSTESKFYGLPLIFTIYCLSIKIQDIVFSINPARLSQIVYSEQYGVGYYTRVPFENQTRIISANGTDNGAYTVLEYVIDLKSHNSNGIDLLNNTLNYTFVFAYSPSDDLNDAPSAHSSFDNPYHVSFLVNTLPEVSIISPANNTMINTLTTIKINATDNDYVSIAEIKIDDGNWTTMFYGPEHDVFHFDFDPREYELGVHHIYIRATDASNETTTPLLLNITIEHPFEAEPGLSIDAFREIHIEVYQLFQVSDLFVIENNGSEPVYSFYVFIPLNYSKYLRTVWATTISMENIVVKKLTPTSNYSRYLVMFPEPLYPLKKYQFKFIAVYSDVQYYVEDPQNPRYEFSFYKWPTIPYVIKNATCKVTAPEGDYVPIAVRNMAGLNIYPLSFVEFSAFYTTSSHTKVIAEITTNIRVDPWGWVVYDNVITLRNVGTATLNRYTILVPAYWYDFKVYDELGILPNSKPEDSLPKNASATFDLDFNRDLLLDGLKPGWNYTFHLFFKTPLSVYAKPNGTGYTLNVKVPQLMNTLIRFHRINYIFPDYVSVIDSPKVSGIYYYPFEKGYYFDYFNTTGYGDYAPYITYVVTIPGVWARPLLFSLLVGFVALIYVVMRHTEIIPTTSEESHETTARTTSAPPELIQKFIELYADKMALNLELDKMNENLRRRKITRAEYRARKSDINTRLKEISKELPVVRKELESYGQKYKDIARDIETHEQQISGAKAGLETLIKNKKRGTITRAVYDKMKADYEKKIRKSSAAIDSLLLLLKEEISD